MDRTYKIEGMTCGGCVGSVTRALQQVSSEIRVEVSLEQGTARVRGPHEEAAIKRAVEDAGFDFGGSV